MNRLQPSGPAKYANNKAINYRIFCEKVFSSLSPSICFPAASAAAWLWDAVDVVNGLVVNDPICNADGFVGAENWALKVSAACPANTER